MTPGSAVRLTSVAELLPTALHGPVRKLYENKNVGPNDILTHQFKHVFRVLKQTVSMRRLFSVHTTMFGLGVTKTFKYFCIDDND